MNKLTPRTLGLPAALSLAMTLAACGGGGGGSPPVTSQPQKPCAGAFTIVADTTVTSGKTAGAAALSCGAPLTSVTWTQVSGPAVSLQAHRMPAVAVETSTAGTIRLQAAVVTGSGQAASTTTQTVDIVVAAAPSPSYLTLRADHSVRPGTQTSVRAWPVLSGGATVSKIVWTQVSGPSVQMDTTDPTLLMFTAPALSATPYDAALKFRATMTTSTGVVDSDDVIVSLDREQAANADGIFDSAARVYPYKAGSPYRDRLVGCTYSANLFFTSPTNNNLCSVNTLPLLQADVPAGQIPTVAQVMDRVVVSHDFLGANFEAFLTTQDANGDFRRLLNGVTAIVIGSHVRPSFYTAGTGAIYLDANNLWLTAAQRDVVTEVPDYRSAFDDQLNFTGVGRLVKDNDYARPSYPSDERVARDVSALTFVLGRLMYHELAHAGDFFAPANRTLDGSKGIFMNVEPRISGKTLPSDLLANSFPLMSAQMKRLGQIMYLGLNSGIDAEKAYTAAQVGAFFASDVANDDYAYSTSPGVNSREDLAMLFEEFMMYHRHGAQADVGYTNVFKDGMTSDDLIVAWGQRGRIGHPNIKPRIKLVLSQIAPWIPASAVDALPAPIQLTAGISWEDNLVQAGPLAASARLRPQDLMGTASKLQRAREDVASRRHAH